jgi:hypothetical protein
MLSADPQPAMWPPFPEGKRNAIVPELRFQLDRTSDGDPRVHWSRENTPFSTI